MQFKRYMKLVSACMHYDTMPMTDGSFFLIKPDNTTKNLNYAGIAFVTEPQMLTQQ